MRAHLQHVRACVRACVRARARAWVGACACACVVTASRTALQLLRIFSLARPSCCFVAVAFVCVCVCVRACASIVCVGVVLQVLEV